MLDKDYLIEKANKRYTAYTPSFYTVFRVGDKFKAKNNGIDTKALTGFMIHNQRIHDIANADPSKKHLNRLLIGGGNVESIVKDYLKGTKFRSNSVFAREIILSAGNGFWEALNFMEREEWVQRNIQYLKKQFGSNCVYACLHMDETTPHIHALIVPRFFNEDKGYYTLNNSYYFDGKDKLSNFQDSYTKWITDRFKNFKRGIRGSKAKHIDLKTFYSLIKENLNEYEAKSILAHAKENFINKLKVEELKQTVEGLENKIDKDKETLNACNKIIENNEKLKKSNELYKHTIRLLSKKYDIPQEQVLGILQKEQGKQNKSKQRERE